MSFIPQAVISPKNQTYYRQVKWQDIDWNNGIINVRSQVAKVNGQIVEAPLKTKNSYRAVTISPQTVEVLKA